MELNELVERIQRWKEKLSPEQGDAMEDGEIVDMDESESSSGDRGGREALEEVSEDDLIED